MAPKQPFPCSLILRIPYPSAHLANTAIRALQVDKELSALVSRTFALEGTTMVVNYAATTNRMLRVAVNGFMESLRLVVHCMEDLDLDVVAQDTKESLDRVQGLETTPV
ncbi:Pcc1-domain-containing protein [Microthyrium microscopicum]|uniref:Pcc1-domain-containing protein n=1 Tax=Microthyrium microscopicum TaxID=703497 RepID=A0A6A6UCY0_9PEZI|nr:Pcc1-domain-containing protein [Microthyrium microscopicum]